MKKFVKILSVMLLLAGVLVLASCDTMFQAMNTYDKTFSAEVSGKDVMLYFSNQSDGPGYKLEVKIGGKTSTNTLHWMIDTDTSATGVKKYFIYKDYDVNSSYTSDYYRIGTLVPDAMIPETLTADGDFSEYIEADGFLNRVKITNGTVFTKGM